MLLLVLCIGVLAIKKFFQFPTNQKIFRYFGDSIKGGKHVEGKMPPPPRRDLQLFSTTSAFLQLFPACCLLVGELSFLSKLIEPVES
jgi:hypothetical protein